MALSLAWVMLSNDSSCESQGDEAEPRLPKGTRVGCVTRQAWRVTAFPLRSRRARRCLAR